MNRRVNEQINFGDSVTALEILKGFEKDELKISDEIEASFKKAMETLKLAGSKKLNTTKSSKSTKGKALGKGAK